MKAIIVGAALAVGTALSLTPGKAEASCRRRVQHGVQAVSVQWQSEDQCETKLEMCIGAM